MECFICKVKSDKVELFDAITEQGIVKICERCSIKEGISLIKKPTNFQIEKAEKKQTVYERLCKIAKLDPIEHRAKFENQEKGEILKRQDEELKIIANKKNKLFFPDSNKIETKTKDDLVRNYHWSIFKARRARRLTQKELAKEIGELESSIKLIERGILPEDYKPILRKLQNYLNITLFNKPIKQEKKLDFDSLTTKELTISDLRGMEPKHSFFPYWKKKLSFLQKIREQKINQEKNNSAEIEFSDSEKKEIPKDISEKTYSTTQNMSEQLNKKPSEKINLTQEEIDKIIFENQ